MLFLCVGYAASQFAYFNGSFEKYALAVDQPRVQILALIAFLLVAILSFWSRDPEIEAQTCFDDNGVKVIKDVS